MHQTGMGMGRHRSAFGMRICLVNMGSPDTSHAGYTDNFLAWISSQVHAGPRSHPRTGLGRARRCRVKEEAWQDKLHLSLKKGIDPFKPFFPKGSKLM